MLSGLGVDITEAETTVQLTAASQYDFGFFYPMNISVDIMLCFLLEKAVWFEDPNENPTEGIVFTVILKNSSYSILLLESLF